MMAAVAAMTLRADVAKFDPRIAADLTQADTNGVVWVDGRDLPLELAAMTMSSMIGAARTLNSLLSAALTAGMSLTVMRDILPQALV